jgi:hypothetical protein
MKLLVTTLAIHIVVFWAAAPCVQAGGHPSFGGTGLAAQKMELISPKVCAHQLHNTLTQSSRAKLVVNCILLLPSSNWTIYMWVQLNIRVWLSLDPLICYRDPKLLLIFVSVRPYIYSETELKQL